MSLAVLLVVAGFAATPVDAKKKAPPKPIKNGFYQQCTTKPECQITAIVAGNGRSFVSFGGNVECSLFINVFTFAGMKIKNGKFAFNGTHEAFDSARERAIVTIKLSGAISSNGKRITGSYTLTTPDADCTPAQQTRKTFALAYKHKTR
jgi:hypothetical protein